MARHRKNAAPRKRFLTLLVALGLGSIALVWGLFWLHGIFLDERDDALAAIEGRRDALRQYAKKELEQTLHKRLSETRGTIDDAENDPLIPASSLYLYDGGEQRLPRIHGAKPSTSSAAHRLYASLTEGPELAVVADSPWGERVAILRTLRDAAVTGDRPVIERAMRGLLAHRARFVIAADKDILSTLVALQLIAKHSNPHPDLMRQVLRDGFGGEHLEGLQRALLRKRARFSPDELARFAKMIVALSRGANVLATDFEGQIAEPSAAKQPIPPDLERPSLALGGGWYVEPAGRGRIMGVKVSSKALLDEIAATMRARGLIERGDDVRMGPGRELVAVERLELTVTSPRWEPAVAAVAERYHLKAVLLWGVAALAFGVVGMGILLYRRRRRFVELKSDFVSAVSHELRTPLASIRLMAETLERRTQGVEGVRDYPTRIIRDIDGLSFLVENILSFDRLQRGRWVPKIEAGLRLSQLLSKLDGERDLWSRGRSVEMITEGLDQVRLAADPDLLQLVLTNLARNACQYSQQEPVRLQVRAWCDAKAWVVAFSDNGVGIPDDERERVFDDFFRAKDRSGRGERGSGLGLSICRKIMQAHGGTIAVADTSDGGTTFELRFPASA